jgi:hypothetical protein
MPPIAVLQYRLLLNSLRSLLHFLLIGCEYAP